MEQRSIAFVGLEEQTISACMSMIGIMQSMASVDWRQSEPKEADLLMIASDQGAPASTQPYVVVYRSGEPKPASRYSLSLPFRARQLMDLLEEIVSATHSNLNRAKIIRKEGGKAAAPAANTSKEPIDYKLWQQIADLMMGAVDADYYSVQTNQGCIYLAPRSREFFVDDTQLQHLQASTLRLSYVGERLATIPANLVARPIFLLPWYALESANSLFLWLRGDVRFKLLRWPHLGFFPRSRERLTLCALLSKHALTFEQLKHMTAASEQSLNQFLNACAVNGLLEIQPIEAKPVRSVTQQTSSGRKTGRFGNMIKSLRFRLGLSTQS